MLLNLCKWRRLIESAAYTITLIFIALCLSTFKATAQTPSIPKNNSTPIGCLSGYPDGSFQGDRPITRYEFAAGMNACLEQINRNIRTNNAERATREDFEALIQRQRELNRELYELNERTSDPTFNKSSF
jgi:hypothetical protein